jgi:DNA polymerase III epsilon subunit-like protein
VSWYLRSIADYDTHHGELQPDATVAARCGIQFTPRRLPRGNARVMLEPGAAVILDTETVGSDTETKVRPTPACEIAVIDACTGQTLISTLINPKTPISKKAFTLHRISDADVANAPTWPEVLPEVLRVTAGRKILAYYSDFDLGVIRLDSDRYHLDPGHLGDEANWDCVMTRRSEWLRNRKWRRLGGGHRALGDCLRTRDVLIGLTASPRR